MSDDITHELRKSAKCIHIAADESVATALAHTLRAAANEIDGLRSRAEQAEERNRRLEAKLERVEALRDDVAHRACTDYTVQSLLRALDEALSAEPRVPEAQYVGIATGAPGEGHCTLIRDYMELRSWVRSMFWSGPPGEEPEDVKEIVRSLIDREHWVADVLWSFATEGDGTVYVAKLDRALAQSEQGREDRGTEMHRRAQRAEGALTKIKERHKDWFERVGGIDEGTRLQLFARSVCEILDLAAAPQPQEGESDD